MKHVVRVLNRFRETFWSTMKWACILREYRFNYSIDKYRLYNSCSCLIRWKRANSIPIIDYDWWNDSVSYILSVCISCEVLFLRREKNGHSQVRAALKMNDRQYYVWLQWALRACIRKWTKATIFSCNFLSSLFVYLFISELEIWRLYNI